MGSSPEIAALPRLYLITDRHAVPNGDLVAAVTAAVAGGVRLVQLREKDLPLDELGRFGSAIGAVIHAAGGRWLVNIGAAPERLDLARELRADGVHLTATSPVTIAEVRERLGNAALVGVSTHSAHEVTLAAARGASFATFGPVFATPSKAGMGEPTGVTALAEAARVAGSMPVHGLGGIGLEEIEPVLSSGAHGVALIRACLAAADPERTSRAVLARLARFDSAT